MRVRRSSNTSLFFLGKLALPGLLFIFLVSCGGQPGEDAEDIPAILPTPSSPEITSHQSPHYSNDPNITLSGSCDAGTRISLSSNGFNFETDCQNSNYSFSFNASSDGEYTYTVTSTNQFNQSSSVSLVWILDRVAPNDIVISNPAVSPFVSPDSEVTFQGSCEADAKIFVTDVATSVVNELSCSSGSFSYTTESKSTDGDYDFSFMQEDLSGNQSSPIQHRWTRDSSIPISPVVAAPAVSPFYTNVSPAVISGSCLEQHRVDLAGDSTQQMTCDGANQYSFNISLATETAYNYTLTQTNLAGTTSNGSNVQVIYDITPPNAPTVDNPGASPYVTALNSINFDGTCEDQATVRVTDDSTGGTQDILCSGGAYSYTSSNKTADGSYLFRVLQTDRAGNVSGETQWTWERDTSAPSVPVVLNPSVNPYYTNVANYVISGQCELGATVYITGDDNQNDPCVGGAFSFNVNFGADGTFNYSIYQRDVAGNSSAIVAQQIVFDQTNPLNPVVTAPGVSPYVSSGNSVNIQGTCEASALVTITDVSLGTSQDVNCIGTSFSYTSGNKTTDGDYDFQISQEDQAGNTSGATSWRWSRASVTEVDITSLIMPVNGTYGVAGEIEFQVQWDEVMTVSGAPRIQLNIGGSNVYAIYVSGSGSQTLAFQYVVSAGNNDADGISATPSIDLNGGSITGTSTNPGATDISGVLGSLAQVLVDTTLTPPAKVTNVEAAPSVDNTKLAISWNVPADGGTPITHYVVQYRVKGDQNWLTQSPNPTTNSSELAGLVANTIYEIRVAASNGTLGPYSDVDEAQIFDIMGFDPIAWLDATDILGDGSTPTDGSLVSTWVDKTASAQSAVETDPTKQPIYTYNAQNGLPAVRFDNLDRGLQGTFTRDNGTNLTIIIVGQYDSSYSDRCMFEFIGPGSARAFFIDRRYAANTFYNPTLTKGSFHMWTITNAGKFATVVEDGTTTIYNGSTAFDTDFIGTGNYFLGDDSTGGNRMYGYIGEILIFDSDLDPADIQQIENYLKAKWGIN